MGLFDRMIGQAINSIANPLINEAGKHIVKQVKDSGVIESTVDDIAYSVTKDTKYAKIMKCPFCGREYDNTEEMCPGCGAPNENRKVDYQKLNSQNNNQNHLLNIGDVISDGNLTIYIVDIKGDNYITTLSKNGSIKTPQKIATVDGALSEGTFHKV